jgi:hypothetical protein
MVAAFAVSSEPARPAPASPHARLAAHILGVGLVTAVLVALPAAPSDLDRHQLPKETVTHLATLLAVLIARPFPPRGLRPGVALGLILLAGGGLLSTFAATDGWLAARALALTLTGIAAFITARQVTHDGAGRQLLGWCVVAAIVGAITGLAQAYGATSVFFAITRSPGGTFGNRNFLAHFAALAVPLTTAAALFAPRRAVAVVAASGGALLTAAIFLSRSRDAWIGVSVGMAVLALAILAVRRRQYLAVSARRVTLVVATAAIAVILAVALPNHLAWRSPSPYADTLVELTNTQRGSGHGRVLQYINSLRLAVRHPLLGVGPANWPIRYGDVALPTDPSWVFSDPIPLNPWPSSDWMALISERGLVGLLGVLLVGIGVVWRGVRALGEGARPAVTAAVLLALAATAAVEGSFDAVLLLPAPLLLVALASGSLLDVVDHVGPSEASHAVSPALWLWRPGVPLLLAAITLRSVLQTSAYLVAGNGHSTARLEAAARLDPTSYAIRISLADRLPCPAARPHAAAALKMAPDWPSARSAARRCQTLPHSVQLPS